MKKVVIGIGSILLMLPILLLIIHLYLKNTKISVSLNGKDEVTMEVFSDYKDPGVTIKKGNKILSKKKYKIKITNNVETNKVGNYQITYEIKVKKKNYKLKRKINIIDDIEPKIAINVDLLEKDYCTKEIKTKYEINATDNYDEDLSDKIITTEMEDKIIFSVTDSSGNKTSKEVELKYLEKPKNKFALNGKNKISILLNNTYNEQGATYTDGCGNKIDKDIKITGTVDTSKVGNYTIIYEVAGEKPLTRSINVYEKVYGPKTIYLTFDDGPGATTKSILDTLDKYNVKATFFVTNQFPGYSYLIKEENNKGHKIAVHTYSHRYSDVYTSVDAYINDFNKMNEIVKEQTGSYSNLFRFPGGSSNTVHCNYAKGIVGDIALEMTNRGYVYFDWNLSSGDAAGYSSNKIYNTVVNGVEKCNPCVVLMHDIKSTTKNALDPILAELTSRGYTFATLNESSFTAHHSVGRCKN